MKRALVVEDDLLVRMTVCHYLTVMGWNPTEAQTGREALNLMQGLCSEVEVIVADIGLPDMTGVELAGKTPPQIPFVFMSGRLRPPPNLPGPMLLKPFSEDTLKRALGRVWGSVKWRPCD